MKTTTTQPYKLKNQFIVLFVCPVLLLLTSCASHSAEQWDCTGLATTQAQTYNKSTQRFMKHDKTLVRMYGLEMMSQPKTLFLRACTSFPNEQHSQQVKKVSIFSNGFHGSYGYLHCAHQSNEPSIKIYEIFINWAKQPLHIREQTLSQTNEKIRAVNCPDSSSATNLAAWYVENEKHGQTPVLVSNAREKIVLSGVFDNRTIAIDLETAQYILKQIKSYL